MKASSKRALAIAVRGDQIFVLFFVGNELEDRAASRPANDDSETALTYVKEMLALYEPGLVISEHPDSAGAKCWRNRRIIQGLVDLFSSTEMKHKLVRRTFEVNRYVRAAALAERFPQLTDWLRDQPPIWETEPRQMGYFEGLDMALEVLEKDAKCDEKHF